MPIRQPFWPSMHTLPSNQSPPPDNPDIVLPNTWQWVIDAVPCWREWWFWWPARHILYIAYAQYFPVCIFLILHRHRTQNMPSWSAGGTTVFTFNSHCGLGICSVHEFSRLWGNFAHLWDPNFIHNRTRSKGGNRRSSLLFVSNVWVTLPYLCNNKKLNKILLYFKGTDVSWKRGVISVWDLLSINMNCSHVGTLL